MSPEQTEKFRRRLEEMKVQLERALEGGGEAAAPVALDSSIGRLSRMDAMQSQQMALELRRRQQNQLMRVQRSMTAIEQGSYGICGKCRGAISEERLEVQPDAVLCVNCMGIK